MKTTTGSTLLSSSSSSSFLDLDFYFLTILVNMWHTSLERHGRLFTFSTSSPFSSTSLFSDDIISTLITFCHFCLSSSLNFFFLLSPTLYLCVSVEIGSLGDVSILYPNPSDPLVTSFCLFADIELPSLFQGLLLFQRAKIPVSCTLNAEL